MPSTWSGRKVPRLVAATLAAKGTICHLCLLPGADSADHNPPRHDLIRAGVQNPDQLRYLFPAHLVPCNKGRGRRPITPQLQLELRAKRLAQTEGTGQPFVSARFRRQP